MSVHLRVRFKKIGVYLRQKTISVSSVPLWFILPSMAFEKIPVQIKRLHGDQPIPAYKTDHSAGMDVHAALDAPVEMTPGQIALIPTGFAVAIPEGFEIQVRPRSGLACKHGISVPNAPGTIDADYRGELKVALINLSQQAFTIEPGMRVAQLILARVPQAALVEVEELSDTERGTGGFGSTGH